MKIVLHCEYCKKPFERYVCQIVSSHNFCSKRCQNLSRLIHVYRCERCGKIFHRPVRIGQRVRFCSQKCHYEQRHEDETRPNCECGICHKRFHLTPYAIKNGEGKFCSNACKSKYQTGRYKGDKPAHYYNLTAWRRLRLKILKRDKYKCTRCGIKPEKLSELHVNHIKFREIGGTDSPRNLETLCRKCHAIVDAERLKELTGNDKARMRDYQRLLHPHQKVL